MKREQERNEDNLDRLVRLSERINWDCFCDEMENALPELKSFLATWGRHCGAPYMVFRGQLCKTILEIWKANSSINTTSPAGAK